MEICRPRIEGGAEGEEPGMGMAEKANGGQGVMAARSGRSAFECWESGA